MHVILIFWSKNLLNTFFFHLNMGHGPNIIKYALSLATWGLKFRNSRNWFLDIWIFINSKNFLNIYLFHWDVRTNVKKHVLYLSSLEEQIWKNLFLNETFRTKRIISQNFIFIQFSINFGWALKSESVRTSFFIRGNCD